jgi:hypothetical protein
VNHRLRVIEASDALCLQQPGKRNQERLEGSKVSGAAESAAATAFFSAPTPEEDFTIQKYPRN